MRLPAPSGVRCESGMGRELAPLLRPKPAAQLWDSPSPSVLAPPPPPPSPGTTSPAWPLLWWVTSCQRHQGAEGRDSFLLSSAHREPAPGPSAPLPQQWWWGCPLPTQGGPHLQPSDTPFLRDIVVTVRAHLYLTMDTPHGLHSFTPELRTVYLPRVRDAGMSRNKSVALQNKYFMGGNSQWTCYNHI